MIDRFGFYVFPWGRRSPTMERVIDLARFGEALGFGSVHLPYHFTLPTSWIFPQFGNRDVLDPLVVLPAIIQATRQIRVALNAAVLPLLNPFVWAKYLATCDVLSGGRLIAGVALGWWEEEFQIAGVSLKQRGQMVDEALAVMKRLWTEDNVTFHGAFTRLENVTLAPKPIQQPHPPILIGGGIASAERAVREASILNPLSLSAAEVRDVYRPRLAELAARYGRTVELAVMTYAVVSADRAWIEREAYPRLQACVTSSSGVVRRPEDVAIYGPPDVCAAQIQALFEAGVDSLILDFQYHGLETEEFAKEHMQRFAEQVVPLLKAPGRAAQRA